MTDGNFPSKRSVRVVSSGRLLGATSMVLPCLLLIEGHGRLAVHRSWSSRHPAFEVSQLPLEVKPTYRKVLGMDPGSTHQEPLESQRAQLCPPLVVQI
jgi:hypothetical protein